MHAIRYFPLLYTQKHTFDSSIFLAKEKYLMEHAINKIYNITQTTFC